MPTPYLPPPSGRPNPLQKLLAVILTAALVALGLMFSALLFAVLLVAVLLGGAYFWWKTRAVRRQMRQMQQAMRDFQAQQVPRDAFRGEAGAGQIIEGEAVHVDPRRDTSG